MTEEVLKFEVLSRAAKSSARLGRVTTPHGSFETPVFMPVGTGGSVKALTQQMLEEAGAQVILGNTYHLMIRPGAELIRELGGLHRFIGWNRSMLTDSGGFQVFSLGALRSISEEGVSFRSHLDGQPVFLSPEQSMEVQFALLPDIAMAFDACVRFPCAREEAAQSVSLTTRWAARSKRAHEALRAEDVKKRQALFGIVQGSVFSDLREQSATEIVKIGFDGYAIGGLSVGEPKDEMFRTLEETARLLPEDRPRYLMGVGTPGDIIRAVDLGVDMCDCVLPARNARNGQLFTSQGKINIRNARHARDGGPIDPNCRCMVCTRYSRAYLRHLHLSKEILASVLASYHNIYFYLDTLRELRQSIAFNSYDRFRERVLQDVERSEEGEGIEEHEHLR